MENVPIISINENGKLIVKGKVDRHAAHTTQLERHATALIVAITPNKNILLADIFRKKEKKAILQSLAPVSKHVILDCFGGHLPYEDIPTEEKTNGIKLNSFLNCAARELQEELFYEDKSPLDINMDQFGYIGTYEYQNDHNIEVSVAFSYFLECEAKFVSQDSIIFPDGHLEEYMQPIHEMPIDRLLSRNLEITQKISDGFGRILDQSEKVDNYRELEQRLISPAPINRDAYVIV